MRVPPVRLATWNVNSIRARLPRLLSFLETRAPDVVCLQETKTLDAEFPSIEIRAAGYDAVTLGQRTYNGVAILSRTPMQAPEYGLGDGVEDPQARLVAATVAGMRVASVYVPNGQAPGTEKFAYKLEWLERLLRWVAKVGPEDSLLLCGDFNVAPEDLDVHDPAAWEGQVLCHPKEREAFRRLIDSGLVDLYRLHHAEGGRYSWWDYRMLGFPKNRGLRIDHVLGTAAVARRCRSAEIDREMRKGREPSDHAPVVVELD
jgi:exodeoxyribonuclease-3